MPEAMTRREFVTAAAMLGAAITVAGTAGCSDGGGARKADVATPSTSYGGSATVSKRILVGYATGTGSTVGVAQAIGEVLAARGYAVDVKPLKESPSLDGYDAAVLGSAVNGGQWLREAVAFVESNREALGAKPLAAFCVHAMNCGMDEKATRKRHAYLDQVRAIVQPADEGYFAGKGPSAAEMSAPMRWIFRAFGGDVEGDGRDWDAIRTWAREVRV